MFLKNCFWQFFLSLMVHRLGYVHSNYSVSESFGILFCKRIQLTGCKIKFISFFFLEFYLFIFDCLGLRCCVQTFSGCGEWRLLSSWGARLLIAGALLIVAPRLKFRLSSYGAWA